MADERRRYGGEPRPRLPVNQQAAAELQERINDRRGQFESYQQQNDAMMRGIGDAWRAGGPSPAGEQFEQARLAREASRAPGPTPGALPPGQSIQVGRAPAIDDAYVRNLAQTTANIQYRQGEHALSREIMNAGPDEALRRLSGLTHEQYAALNPSRDGRRPGDTQPIAAPGRPYPGDTGPHGQAAPGDARFGQRYPGGPAGPADGRFGQQYPGGPAGPGAHAGGPGAQAGGPGAPGAPQQGQQGQHGQAGQQGERSGFRMPWRKSDRSTGRHNGRGA